MCALEYLLVMTQDEGVSATATIVGRLQLSPTSLMSYRRLLILRQVIEQTARGYVKFAIPCMGECPAANRETLLARYGHWGRCSICCCGERWVGQDSCFRLSEGRIFGHCAVEGVAIGVIAAKSSRSARAETVFLAAFVEGGLGGAAGSAVVRLRAVMQPPSPPSALCGRRRASAWHPRRLPRPRHR